MKFSTPRVITEHTTVGQIASGLPSSVRVFQKFGIDFCCGGGPPHALACQERGVPLADVGDALEASSQARSDDRDWSREPLSALIDHIVTTYHDSLREELPRLQSLARKSSRVHGARAPQLLRLAAIVDDLSADLLTHMRKEELMLFPAIRAIAQGRDQAAIAISAPIAVMEHEHDRAGAMLSDLRDITSGYTAPAWACATVRALYDGLSELESTMHVHVHLENNVLFPRALEVS
jgi:regulator of cell morphogenesis and NO signaling